VFVIKSIMALSVSASLIVPYVRLVDARYLLGLHGVLPVCFSDLNVFFE
jgi:hypothetical protein